MKIVTPILAALSFVPLFISAPGNAQSAQQAIERQLQEQNIASSAQEKIDDLDDASNDMAVKYRNLLQQTEDLEIYNEQMVRLINNQEIEIAEYDAELAALEQTRRQILPLMHQMVDTLSEIIAVDAPFLARERQLRLNELKELMERADVTVAEKYRRLMEAYQVESEYGHNIEAYQGELENGDKTRTVNFLRFGRVALFYLSLDGESLGVWDKNTSQWQTLDSRYKEHLDRAIRIARKQMPPDLLRLPIPQAARAGS